MKFASILLYWPAFISQSVSAHYIFNALVYSNKTSTAAVRAPRDHSPVKPVNSRGMACNVNTVDATETVIVAAGSRIGFRLSEDSTIYHAGPAAIYLGKAPGSAADWDGSGSHWFKIAEWGAAFSPFRFLSLGREELVTTIPKNTSPGQYLVRVEHLGMHVVPPESFVSCAQIKVTGAGTGRPPMVAIPGYISGDDPSVSLNI